MLRKDLWVAVKSSDIILHYEVYCIPFVIANAFYFIKYECFNQTSVIIFPVFVVSVKGRDMVALKYKACASSFNFYLLCTQTQLKIFHSKKFPSIYNSELDINFIIIVIAYYYQIYLLLFISSEDCIDKRRHYQVYHPES